MVRNYYPVADTENSETLKVLLKFEGKDPEQSRQEFNVWLVQSTMLPETPEATRSYSKKYKSGG